MARGRKKDEMLYISNLIYAELFQPIDDN